jgi:hypothetical protein
MSNKVEFHGGYWLLVFGYSFNDTTDFSGSERNSLQKLSGFYISVKSGKGKVKRKSLTQRRRGKTKKENANRLTQKVEWRKFLEFFGRSVLRPYSFLL